MEKIGIIGYGEIGKALSNVYRQKEFDVRIFDPFLGKEDDLYGVDILNICYPNSKNFVDITNEYIEKFKPTISIIHSTVSAGTTKNIIGRVCHSPVRGLHPNLEEGILTFLKYIGSENKEWAEFYEKHLNKIGVKTYICKDSLTSEYSKLIDTTYYGICIAFHNEINRICVDNEILFEEVMTKYNDSYNVGYTKLKKNNFVRPILYPSDRIGGHCIIPNAKILLEHFDSNLIKEIIKYE